MTGQKLSEAIRLLKTAMEEEGIDPRKGLGTELFLFSTTLAPCLTVDLLIRDAQGRLLLAWRDDVYNGKGWHIPGGCVRLHESLEQRVQRSALQEVGTEVIFAEKPLAVREDIILHPRAEVRNKLERSHNVSFLFDCRLPDGYAVPEFCGGTRLRWFDSWPEQMLEAHLRQYGDILGKVFKGEPLS